MLLKLRSQRRTVHDWRRSSEEEGAAYAAERHPEAEDEPEIDERN